MIVIFKGLLIGVLASILIGPIFILVVQESVCHGQKAGFSCAMGATLVDTFGALISVFTLSIVGYLMNEYKEEICIVGSLIVMAIGVWMVFSELKRTENGNDCQKYSPKNFLKACAMGFSNPGAPAAVLALYAMFNVDLSNESIGISIGSIVAVAVGSMFFWHVATTFMEKFRNKISFAKIKTFRKLSGAVIALFGIIVLIKTLI